MDNPKTSAISILEPDWLREKTAFQEENRPTHKVSIEKGVKRLLVSGSNAVALQKGTV